MKKAVSKAKNVSAVRLSSVVETIIAKEIERRPGASKTSIIIEAVIKLGLERPEYREDIKQLLRDDPAYAAVIRAFSPES